jgi:hypothetical protein
MISCSMIVPRMPIVFTLAANHNVQCKASAP